VIEEPEAHLHAQLQQVFIKKVRDILPDDDAGFATQLIVTTHSPHIVYASDFKPIRYFRRVATGRYSDVLNLSTFWEGEVQARDFLLRYMKVTHCDLFFADAAILVEGNVERLLLPLMIEKETPALASSYLSIIEVGGAFAHKFEPLVHFLGVTTLIITDLDSITPTPEESPEAGAGEESSEPTTTAVCMTHEPGAVTSNHCLIKWLPQREKISDLLAASKSDRCFVPTGDKPAQVCVAYQNSEEVRWRGETDRRAGRTLEEAFAFQNLEWCQDIERAPLGLRVVRKKEMSIAELTDKIHRKVRRDGFKKTDFALALMNSDEGWTVPAYIAAGLKWLRTQVTSATAASTAEPPGEPGR
jgi:hypothetical protein